MERWVVLTSGGVESAALVALMLERGEVVPVYVRTGLPHEATEARKIRALLNVIARQGLHPLREIVLQGISLSLPAELLREEDVEIPLRNLTLAGVGALVAHEVDARGVAMGTLGNAPFPDNHRDYLDRLEQLLREGLRRPAFALLTPFMGRPKEEILRTFAGRVPWERTFSCMSPVRGEHCGTCDKCRERHTAFLRAGLPDPTFYRTPPIPYPDSPGES